MIAQDIYPADIWSVSAHTSRQNRMTAQFSADHQEVQLQLQVTLNEEPRARQLEVLAAKLIGRLLEIEVAIAKSGFQHGGDAGSAGRQGRRFRIECKKYRETTANRDRELLGEIDQAVARDEAIEAWILVATRSVPEQLRQDLEQHGDRLGVPIIVLSWADDRLSTLAALCATAPDIVGTTFSLDAGELAAKLAPIAKDTIDEIRRDLQSWNIGFESIRLKSHRKLNDIWQLPKMSNAELGQDAAGGAQPKKIKRTIVGRGLDTWWAGPAHNDAPAVIVGADGAGKTWATLDWIVEHAETQPIIFLTPSSAVASLQAPSETAIKHFFAGRCHELTGTRNVDHWLRRLDRLLARPTDEGSVITVIFDGINQETSVAWLQILKILQGPTFSGRIRTVINTRPHFLSERLSHLKGLVEPAVTIATNVYDIEPGGELDQMLAFEGLTRSNLHPDLIDLARTPRLFKLVVRLRDRLIDAEKVTIHRLLWEYGRDSFGERAGRSFSEHEWQQYLHDIALELRKGVSEFSMKMLGDTASRADLNPGEVYARLSDIVDGRFTTGGVTGRVEFIPAIVSHSLAAALLTELAPLNGKNYEAVDTALSQWLDPIAGLDQRAEVLRAAISILIEQGARAEVVVAGALVTAWLQTQNLTDHHRRELAALSADLVSPLLDAVEHSTSRAQTSARLWAVYALRAVPRTDASALKLIVGRCADWLRMVSRGVWNRPAENKDFETHRVERIVAVIGVDRSGPMTILGQPMTLVDLSDGVLHETVPSILEAFPLTQVVPLLEIAVINEAVGEGNAGVDGLRWLLVLNEIDPDETANVVRQRATAIQKSSPEPGINPDLPAKVARRLLFLTGYESDEIAAQAISSALGAEWSYETDYLACPAKSAFALEYRHVESVITDETMPLHARLRRTKPFWHSPEFEAPISVISEIREAASSVDPAKLDSNFGPTIEDHAFEEFEPALARCAPDLLTNIARRKLIALRDATPEQRYWRAVSAPHQLIVSDESSGESAHSLREKSAESDEGNELYAASQLLLVEVHEEKSAVQASRVIEAGLKTILTDFAFVLGSLTSTAVETLLDRFGQGTKKEQHDLLCILSFSPSNLNSRAWAWLEEKIQADDQVDRGIAFRTLQRADAERFGQFLTQRSWTWKREEHFWVNHYGSGALIAATVSVPFEQILPCLAPWRSLEAARVRGGDPAEIRLAALTFSDILAAHDAPELDPGSDLLVELPEWEHYPSFYTLELRKEQRDSDDPFASSKEIQNVDVQRDAWNRATETARERIENARRSGASLYLANVDSEDLALVWIHMPELFDRWIEGFESVTADFKRRVSLADATYLAICETLLNHDPDRGVRVWHALRRVAAVRYIGSGGVDELVHIAFRAKDSPAVDGLRTSLGALLFCPTDEALRGFSFAATFNGQRRWLDAYIDVDSKSPFAWRRKRAIMVSGFIFDSDIDAIDDWPAGPAMNSTERMKRGAMLRKRDDAAAHYWWCAYLGAQTVESAYAAWVLFLRTCDRRSSAWIRRDLATLKDESELSARKISHAEVNRSSIKKQSRPRDRELQDTFLGTRIFNGVGPWGVDTTLQHGA